MARVEKWRITSDGRGMGGHLCPPGHPNHTYVVWEGWRTSMQYARTLMAVDSVINEEYVPADIRRRAANLIKSADLKCSELWLRNVYGYFRNMYQLSDSRGPYDLTVVTDGSGPAEKHGAVGVVRQYFPDHQPRLDLIEESVRPGARLYGSWPCVNCGERVQYEARHDALVPFSSPYMPCGNKTGVRHSWWICPVGSESDTPCPNGVNFVERHMCDDHWHATGPIGD